MATDGSSIQIGALLRQDATGAWHQATLAGRPYTLRILRPDLADSEEARLVFEQELRRIERLQHPALLRVHRVGRGAPRPWLLTDPIEGPTLHDAVSEGGPLALAEARALAGSLHAALRYLDGRRQVHAAPWPTQFVQVEGRWVLPTFRAIRARDGLKNLKRRTNAHEAWTPPEHAPDHPARLAPEPWIAWAVGTLLRVTAGEAPEVMGAVERLCDPDPARRPHGERAVTAALAGEGTGPAAGSRPAAPVPQRKRRPGRRG